MRKAFTLIELLVVIAIIAILAAILFPVFAQAKLAAKQTSSLSEVKQIMTSEIMYNTDNDDVQVPYLWYNRGDGVFITWMEMLYPYTKNKSIFLHNAASTSQGAYGATCTSTSSPTVMSHYIMPLWFNYQYWSWWGTVMFGGFPIDDNPLSNCSVGLPTYGACKGMTHVDEPASATVLVPGYFVSYYRPAPALESNTQFGSACTTGFDPTKGATSAVQVFKNGGNYGMADGHAKWYVTTNMNANASRPHPYGGSNYPSSPYMVVIE